jgi:hypothetical protein
MTVWTHVAATRVHADKLGPGGRSAVIEQQSIDVSFWPGNGRLCVFEDEGPLLARLRKYGTIARAGFGSVRIPFGYHNREPLDLSPFALW